MYKAKYLYSMGNSYYYSKFFEYKGHEYEVTYSSGYTTFKQKSAKQQHEENQRRIDEMINNPVKEEKLKATNKVQDALDYFFEMLGE